MYRRDNTEIDMRLGELLVEAKLTESDFQSANIGLISRYRDLETVFHIEELPFDEWEAQQLRIDSRYACGARHEDLQRLI